MLYIKVKTETQSHIPSGKSMDSRLQSGSLLNFPGYGYSVYPGDNSWSGIDNINATALMQVTRGIMSDVPPVQFSNAVDKANSAMGNRTFLQFVNGLYDQRRQLDIQGIAAYGVRGAGRPMTHLDTIQRAFGHHDVSSMREHTGRNAQESLSILGAEGFSSNGCMAFAGTPDLFTQAHEAAHGVQQAAFNGGLRLKGGIGEPGDKYERHADAVAEKVVSGESAEGILDDMTGGIQAVVGTTIGAGTIQFNGEIIDKFKNSKSRLIFLDYDGTLVEFHEDPMQATPDDDLHEIIERLARYENTKVVVISGRKKEDLMEFLGRHEEVEFVAEHGILRKRPGDKDWTALVALDLSWKEQLRSIIQGYVDRVPGSYMEEKAYSLGWQYRPAPDIAQAHLAGKQLETELRSYFNQKDKDDNNEWLVTNDKMVVEINTGATDKGTAVTAITREGKYDFVMAMGDGSTDEFMFRSLPDHQTVKVGVGATAARYTVNGVADVRKLLKDLVV